MNKRRSPWPDDIQLWLRTLLDEANSDGERQRVERLAYDPRVGRVADGLSGLPYRIDTFEHPTRLFLHHALDLAAIAERLAEVGHGFRKKELQNLSQVTDRFLGPLALHRATIAAYLAGPDPYTEGLRRYEELAKTIRIISEKAAGGADLPGLDKYLAPVRKGQEHTYFADMLGQYAEELYGVPLDEEVGILAGVCFNIIELGPAEVRAIRARRSKVNSESKKK